MCGCVFAACHSGSRKEGTLPCWPGVEYRATRHGPVRLRPRTPLLMRGRSVGRSSGSYPEGRRSESCPRTHALVVQWQNGRLLTVGRRIVTSPERVTQHCRIRLLRLVIERSWVRIPSCPHGHVAQLARALTYRFRSLSALYHRSIVQWQNGGLQNRSPLFDSECSCQGLPVCCG